MFDQRHLLGIEGLDRDDVHSILDLADDYVAQNRRRDKKSAQLRGLTQINLFFENSTRTQASFELAGKRLGADVMNMALRNSSIKKGETLLDTAATLNAMHPDILVVRHAASGAAKLLSQKVNCAVVNAGDGMHEHPTQALLDALTIRAEQGAAPPPHGRDLRRRGAQPRGAVQHDPARADGEPGAGRGAPTLLPPEVDRYGVEVFHDMEAGIEGADVVMMLRLQSERMEGGFVPSRREYFHRYGLDHLKLARAADDAIVMHPGPMNRGVEIDALVADDIPRSVIAEQVEMGVAVRMAVLDLLAQRIAGEGA